MADKTCDTCLYDEARSDAPECQDCGVTSREGWAPKIDATTPAEPQEDNSAPPTHLGAGTPVRAPQAFLDGMLRRAAEQAVYDAEDALRAAGMLLGRGACWE